MATIFTIMTPLIYKLRRISVVLRIIRPDDCNDAANLAMEREEVIDLVPNQRE